MGFIRRGLSCGFTDEYFTQNQLKATGNFKLNLTPGSIIITQCVTKVNPFILRFAAEFRSLKNASNMKFS